MKNTLITLLLAFAFALGLSAQTLNKDQQYEKLNRGLIVTKLPNSAKAFLSWRYLGTDDPSVRFNVYKVASGEATKLNSEPLKVTNFTASSTLASNKFYVEVLDKDGKVIETTPEVSRVENPFLKLKLDRPAGGVTLAPNYAGDSKNLAEYPNGEPYSYSPNDCSVGDVDGDGEYELFVKWDPSNSHDNSHRGYTGNVYIDCYKFDGTKLWRIDLGCNIRAGAHYTQFLVYDFDGDGKAELACKTAPGTIDGQGNAVLMGSDKVTDDYRKKGGNSSTLGTILSGPEYLTVFNGETGAEMATVKYEPARNINSSWGDSYGNRSERYLACVAYLDGKTPSMVFCRGYYTAAYVTAYDWDGKEITKQWMYSSTEAGAKELYGQGAHGISVGDVDGDGCDEIVFGSATLDHSGVCLSSTRLGHGDALHLSDLMPDRKGLEVFMVHEEKAGGYAAEIHDPRTGEILVRKNYSADNGRGIALDLDPNYRGFEWCSQGDDNVYDINGNAISAKKPARNFRIYWNGDLYDEDLDGGNGKEIVAKTWNPSTKSMTSCASFTSIAGISTLHSCNTTKSTPNLTADIFGDWREEAIYWDSKDSCTIYVFTTQIPTEHRVMTLMHDHVYRMGIAWQNVAYNQPPHLGYFLPDVLNNDARLVASGGALTQKVEVGQPITDITLKYVNATGVKISGDVPNGISVEDNKSEQSVTISGSIDNAGKYTMLVETVGAEGDNAKVEIVLETYESTLTKVACYPFDGNLQNTLTGKSLEAVTYTPSYQTGKAGQSVAFSADPATARLVEKHYDGINFSTESFTVEMWFKSTDKTTSSKYFIHKGSHTANASTGATGKWFGFEYKNSNISFSVDDDKVKSTATLSGASSYFDGNWHHLVGIRDTENKTVKFYIDAKLVAEAADGTGDISETEDMVIGNCNVNFNAAFIGEIDELSLYTGAMNLTTIQEHYKGTVTGIRNYFSSDAAQPILYDIHGRKVEAPTAGGVYILKTGNNIKKVFVN